MEADPWAMPRTGLSRDLSVQLGAVKTFPGMQPKAQAGVEGSLLPHPSPSSNAVSQTHPGRGRGASLPRPTAPSS